jgi:UDP-N-acetylglucosamine--N-acetylmuramyl-(pentapeptide) pyrophosphoryl-undecaprenol N-acetylglucosamine transferase
LRLLVIGGSLGAKALNQIVPQALAQMHPDARPEVRHQSGAKNIDELKANYAAVGIEADCRAFIDDMAEAYAWCDVVLCRAGASTVAELAAAGVPAGMVPFPSAVDDHQTLNAASWPMPAPAGCCRRTNSTPANWPPGWAA